MHLVAIGGSDAGISAALRARELDPTIDVTVVVAELEKSAMPLNFELSRMRTSSAVSWATSAVILA